MSNVVVFIHVVQQRLVTLAAALLVAGWKLEGVRKRKRDTTIGSKLKLYSGGLEKINLMFNFFCDGLKQ